MVFAQNRIRSRNETHKILRDFEIQTDNLIPASRADFILLPSSGFYRSAVPHRRNIKESQQNNGEIGSQKNNRDESIVKIG